MHDTCPTARLVEAHPLAYATHRLVRERLTARRARGERGVHGRAISPQFSRAAPNRCELLLHRFEQHLLAVDAAPARRRALLGNVLPRCWRTERLVKVIDVTNLGRAGVRSLDALGVGDRGPQLRPDLVAGLEQTNGIAH